MLLVKEIQDHFSNSPSLLSSLSHTLIWYQSFDILISCLPFTQIMLFDYNTSTFTPTLSTPSLPMIHISIPISTKLNVQICLHEDPK
jgi:hypothetical protein